MSSLDYSISPLEIGEKLDIPPGSARSTLSKLFAKGLLNKPVYGKYCIAKGHGPSSEIFTSPPRVQNLIFVSEGVGVRDSLAWVLTVSDYVTLRFTCGMSNDRISVRVKAPLGLDLVGLDFLIYVIDSELKKIEYVIPFDCWECRNVEFFWDYWGFRLEGMSAVTFQGLRGELEKWYNRPAVRHEVRASPRSVSFKQLQSLVAGGVESSRFHGRLFALEARMDRHEKALKFHNDITYKMAKSLNAIQNGLFKILDSVTSCTTRL